MNSNDFTIECNDCSEIVDINICSKVGLRLVCFNCALRYKSKLLKDPRGYSPNGIICRRCKRPKHKNSFMMKSERSGCFKIKTCRHCILKMKIRSERERLRRAHN